MWLRNKLPRDQPEFHSHKGRVLIFFFVCSPSSSEQKPSNLAEGSNHKHLLKKKRTLISASNFLAKSKLEKSGKVTWLRVWINTGTNLPLKLISLLTGGLYDSTCIFNKIFNVVNRAGWKMFSQRDGECLFPFWLSLLILER